MIIRSLFSQSLCFGYNASVDIRRSTLLTLQMFDMLPAKTKTFFTNCSPYKPS